LASAGGAIHWACRAHLQPARPSHAPIKGPAAAPCSPRLTLPNWGLPQVRIFFFNKIQSALGLMNTATLGTMLGACAYLGYSFLDGGKFSMWLFFLLAGVGNIGLSFSGASITPFFSNLGNKSNMGRIMSINSATSSLGRVVGPPMFGAIYAWNIRLPYRLAALFTVVSAAVFFFMAVLTAKPTQADERPDKPLASEDGNQKKLDNKKALAELTELMKSTLVSRAYDLTSPQVVDYLKAIIDDALPLKVEGRSDEELLGKETEFLHSHWAEMNKQSVHAHPHS